MTASIPTTFNRPVREKVYGPRGAARDLFTNKAREVLACGPAGTGKSRGCLEKLHLCALKYAGMRGLMVRKTRRSLTQTALVTFEKAVLDPADGVAFRTTEQEYRYPNGSVIVVAGLDKPSKIMSSEFDLIYVQEATELTEDDWESLTSRLRNGKMPYQQILADCNPDAPTHWLKRRADAGRTVMLDSRHEDNPAVTAAYLETLDALSGVRYLRLRLGQWAAAEGMVYEGWDRAVHLIDPFPIPADWPRYWVVDFGFTNPFCWQAWAEDGDGRLYRYREIYRTQRLVEDHARDILAVTQGEPRPVAIICDHDAEDRATLERHLSMTTIAAHKAVSPGIQAVAARLRPAGDGKARLFFVRDALTSRDTGLADAHKPVCTEEEVEGYVWDTSQNRRKGEQPVKKDDHGCLVAGTLILTSDGLVPIERVYPGAIVLTRGGLRRVLASGLTNPAAPVLTVALSNGRALTGTGNHPVWVIGKGWTRLDALRYNDALCAEIPRASRSTASCFDVIPTPRDGQIGCISFPILATVSAASGDYTKKFGRRRTGLSRMGARFITAMETRSTMTLPTLPASRWQNTLLGIGITRRRLVPHSLNTSPLFARWLPHGIDRKRGGNGIANIAEPFGKGATIETVFATSAAVATRPANSPVTGSVPTDAGLRHGAIAASMMSNEPAPIVLKPSWSTDTGRSDVVPVRVLSVCALDSPAPVYNLTVEGAPEYFANGVLVHNCDAMRYLVAHRDLVGAVSYAPGLWD